MHLQLLPTCAEKLGNIRHARTAAKTRPVHILQAYGPNCGPSSTPLLDAVQSRAASAEDVPFHVPGHKKGLGVHDVFRRLVKDEVLRADLTELRVLATCGPGQTLLLSRNCHLSAFSAMTLAGCDPWWLFPECDPQHGTAHGITPHQLRNAFACVVQQGLRPGAVLLVSPTYFGACSHTKELADVCHEHGVPLIVDEAHGAHFGLHPDLPPGALHQGADLVVQSTHKTLSAMTQAAMLHMRGQRVDAALVSRALQVLQSSSPSYVLMASLDAARLAASDPRSFDEALRAAQVARTGLQQMDGLCVLGSDPAATTPASVSCWDPLRVVVDVQALGMSGFEAAEQLEDWHHIIPELATMQTVVLALGPGSLQSHAEALVEAFRQIAGSSKRDQQVYRSAGTASQEQPDRLFSPRDAFRRPTERVSLEAAVGRASGELLCPYPPGVPAVYPGELVTLDAVALLQSTLAAGGAVTGASDGSLRSMLVLK